MLNTTTTPFTLLLTTIPGPNRQRTPTIYQYRMVYRNHETNMGCEMVWEVTGGRTPYQIAVERTESGQIQWHCSCADAVYRGEKVANHRCKHVHGLMECTPTHREGKTTPASQPS